MKKERDLFLSLAKVIIAQNKIEKDNSMKKNCANYLFIVLSIFSLGFLTSCGETDGVKPLPTITFIPNETTVELNANQTYDISVTYSADQKLDKINVYKTVGATENTHIPSKISGFNSNTEHIQVYTLTAEASGEVKYRFNLVDKDGQETSKTLTLITKTTAGQIESYDVVLLGSQNATLGSFYSSSNNTVYKIADAKTNSSKVDFGYAVGASKGAMIGAPDDDAMKAIFNGATSGIQTWSSKNQTTFKATSLTSGQFDGISDDLMITANSPEGAFTTGDSGNSRAKSSEITAGKVVAFKTKEGKIGLFKVTEINDDQVKLSVKVQK